VSDLIDAILLPRKDLQNKKNTSMLETLILFVIIFQRN